MAQNHVLSNVSCCIGWSENLTCSSERPWNEYAKICNGLISSSNTSRENQQNVFTKKAWIHWCVANCTSCIWSEKAVTQACYGRNLCLALPQTSLKLLNDHCVSFGGKKWRRKGSKEMDPITLSSRILRQNSLSQILLYLLFLAFRIAKNPNAELIFFRNKNVMPSIVFYFHFNQVKILRWLKYFRCLKVSLILNLLVIGTKESKREWLNLDL